MKFSLIKLRNIAVLCGLKCFFDILNCLGVADECDRQTDRRAAVSNSVVRSLITHAKNWPQAAVLPSNGQKSPKLVLNANP